MMVSSEKRDRFMSYAHANHLFVVNSLNVFILVTSFIVQQERVIAVCPKYLIK